MQMPLSSSSVAAILFIILFTHLTMSFPVDPAYADCKGTFSCGSVQNISYPFTGGDRPDHCGPPEFRLTCRNNQAEFTSNSVTYRVLDINETQKTMILARQDLWNNTCPREFINSTLDSPFFNQSINDEDLTLIYGCNSPPKNLTLQNPFTCNVPGVNFTSAYYLVGSLPRDATCAVSVTLPLLRTAGERLTSNMTTLAEALTEGFSVNYGNWYARECSECIRVGGQCGFDPSLGRPICICGDKPCPLVPPPSPAGNSSSKKAVTIVLPIVGAIVAVIVIGWLFFFRKQRRRPPAAKAAQTQSEESLTIPSGKNLISPPLTTFTRSIPSFPSSKSSFGKGSSYFGVQVFSNTELEEATDNFDRSRELGDGGFGTVYYGKLHDGRVVAVKRLYENSFKRVEQFMNEVEILTRLRHNNLVTLYGCTSRRSRELLLVYEYIPNGTVADHLHGKRAKSGLLSWSVRLNIAVETADALAYLHRSDVIHRDVKTTNILLDKDFCVKVADFGLSRLFPNDATHVSTAPQGTPGYVDPEYFKSYQLTEKSDVYSFGVVLIELISSLEAVDTKRHRDDINLFNMAVNKIQNHALHELVDPSLGFKTNGSVRRMTTLVAELAFQCLQQERDMRPSMNEVLGRLREIQNEGLNAENAQAVKILVDDDVPLKDNANPVSPDSVIPSEWTSSSTINSSC